MSGGMIDLENNTGQSSLLTNIAYHYVAVLAGLLS